MIGGRRPLPGRKPADRRVRVERPHSPYFRYAGPGQLVAKRAASGPRTRAGRLVERVKVATIGRPLAIGGGDRRTPLEEEGARHLQLRRHLLERLCDRGDPAGPGPRRRRGAHRLDPGRGRDHDHADRRRVLVPPGVPRLPERRRRLCGRPFRAHAPPRAHRRGGPAHRLRHDRRGVDVLGTRPAGLTRPAAGGLEGRGGHRRHRAHHDRQPARAARVRQHLRRPHLRVRRARAGDRGGRAREHRGRHRPTAPPPGRRGALRDRATRALPAADAPSRPDPSR